MEQPIRVLHTLGWVTQGGVERLRLFMAEGLSPELYGHALICKVAEPPIADQLRNNGWEVHEIGLAPHIVGINWHLKAWKIGNKFRPHIVHGAVFEGSALAVVIGLLAPYAKVIIEEQSDGRGRRWGGTALLRTLSVFADLCVGVAPEIVSYLRRRVRINPKKIRLVNNGVPSSSSLSIRRQRGIRLELGIAEGELVIGSVGRLLDDHKRFSDLIRAMAQLPADGPSIKLLIVGEGVDRHVLEELAKECHVAEKCIFAGFRPDVRDIYAVMDIFALVSAGEALPLALIEAMHAGLPAVATAVGGNPFVLDDGAAGILLPPADPEALEEALISLINDESMRADLGSKAQLRARAEFSVDAYLKNIEALWAEVLTIK